MAFLRKRKIFMTGFWISARNKTGGRRREPKKEQRYKTPLIDELRQEQKKQLIFTGPVNFG